jgi:hypothetical protein
MVLSRDGLVLGAFPEDESEMKPAWLRFATLGEPVKSFVEFGDQIWAYVNRGPYAAFIVAGTELRPGVLIDHMEQVLLAAEEARTKREPLKVPDASAAPSGKPRTSLHPPAGREQPAEIAVAPEPPAPDRRAWSRGIPTSAGADPADHEAPPPAEPSVAAEPPLIAEASHHGSLSAGAEPPAAGLTPVPPTADPGSPGPSWTDPLPAEDLTASKEDGAPVTDVAAGAPTPSIGSDVSPAAPSGWHREPPRLAGSPGEDRGDEEGSEDGDGDIDRVMLAKEFSGLLQLDQGSDEEGS